MFPTFLRLFTVLRPVVTSFHPSSSCRSALHTSCVFAVFLSGRALLLNNVLLIAFGTLCQIRSVWDFDELVNQHLSALCWGRFRQTSPYSLFAECAAGCLRASSGGIREGVRQEVREVKGEIKVEESRSLHERMWMG